MERYRIYGKHQSEKRFGAMNLSSGCVAGNLIYASILTAEEKEKFMTVVAPQNPEWIFEARGVDA